MRKQYTPMRERKPEQFCHLWGLDKPTHKSMIDWLDRYIRLSSTRNLAVLDRLESIKDMIDHLASVIDVSNEQFAELQKQRDELLEALITAAMAFEIRGNTGDAYLARSAIASVEGSSNG